MYGGKVPFGDLRNQWRKQHCRTLNPYGSDDCPWDKRDCIKAYSDAIDKMFRAKPDKPVGYFIKVARVDAARRADEGVDKRIRQRYRATETNVPAAETPPAEIAGDTGDETVGLRQRQGLRSPESGPTGIGELLGTLDVRPRSVQTHKGKEGAE